MNRQGKIVDSKKKNIINKLYKNEIIKQEFKDIKEKLNVNEKNLKEYIEEKNKCVINEIKNKVISESKILNDKSEEVKRKINDVDIKSSNIKTELMNYIQLKGDEVKSSLTSEIRTLKNSVNEHNNTLTTTINTQSSNITNNIIK